MADESEWEEIGQNISAMVHTTLIQLHTLWVEIGYDKEAQTTYKMQVHDHIQELLNDMVLEMEEKKKVLLEESQQLIQNTAVLCKELKETIDTEGYETLTILKLQQVLQSDMEKLLHIKEQRKICLNELLKKEHEICKRLGVQVIGINSQLPTEEELSNFKLYIEKQEEEKNRIESEFKIKYKRIAKMIDDLGVNPSSYFEEILYNEPENFVLTPTNMAMLKEVQEKLEAQLERVKEEVEVLKEKLIALWEDLDEPADSRQAFFDTYSGYSQTTITAINAEIERCKEKAHIAKSVTEIRAELMNLWNLCKYSEFQRKRFTAFYSRIYTEDLLTLHKLEVDKVRKFYDTNRSIFDLLEERENLWSKMNELEHRANNPDRLNNRGGQLLAEEKERKVIQKKLPKIETQLRSLINEYETKQEEPFCINGVSLEEFLAESWANRNMEKETKKNARKEAKDKSIKKASATKKTPIASTSRLHTPMSTSKRKLIFGSTPNSSAKRRNVGSDKIRSVPHTYKIRRSGKVSRRMLSENKKRRSGQEKSKSSLENIPNPDTTYGQFQAHLKERDELRSSLIPEQVLANKSSLRTPNRTPMKPLRKNLYNVNASSSTTKLSHSSHRSPRSPRIDHTPKLVTAPNELPIIF
ncbi:hypothetical protein KPH14_011245 [Odynerus spinipes]|uniref:Protein regulator of cytokinesis 1 n=1 Tax=Odynerus spinipes TaxID=1348599 RepID=A0AAD9VJ20_9HYME|nr:hypothetical protein KPH14_011245 [Odynerus spinipes]